MRKIKKTGCMVLVLLCMLQLVSCASQTIQQTELSDESTYIFAMGTVFEIRIIGEDADTVIADIEAAIYNLDGLISWREDGTLTSQFNATHSVDVSEIAVFFEKTLQICYDSMGALDLTVLPLSQLWGFDTVGDSDYDASLMTVPDDEAIREVLEKIDYTQLLYDTQTNILSTENEALSIELGAAGKGYAIDAAWSIMEEEGISGGMVSAGSSICVYGTKTDGSAFRVALRDPRGDESERVGVLTLTDTTISTSGDYERYFESDGIRYHHILDPRTGYPADSGLMQVTIISDEGTIGDALSTACFVLGLDDGMALANQYGVMAIFIDTDKTIWYNCTEILDIFDFTGSDAGYVLQEYHQS